MKIRVLVAEDHPLVREGVIRALERDPGVQVIGEADNGITAMELARQLKPDVMVLDLRMPGLGGAVVLERLCAELPEIRALVMTANESPESLLDAVAAGAAGYLSKRTTGEELRQAVITTYGGGSVITPELAGHLLREFSGSARGEGSSVRPLLAARELEILRLVADGLTDNEIGNSCISRRARSRTTSRAYARRPGCAAAPSSPAGPSSTRSPEQRRPLDPGARGAPRQAPRSPVATRHSRARPHRPDKPVAYTRCPGAQTKGSSMTRLSCPSCRLRFTAAATATITTCPDCGRDLQAVISAEDTLGFRLFTPMDPQPELPVAVEAALPIHNLRPDCT